MSWPWQPRQPYPPFPQPVHPSLQQLSQLQPSAVPPPPPPPQFFSFQPYQHHQPQQYHPPRQNYCPHPHQHAIQEYTSYHDPAPFSNYSTQHTEPQATPQPTQPQNRNLGKEQAPQNRHATHKPHAKANNKQATRDLATAHDTARRLGTSLPGNTDDEIRRWVEARRRNWPSRKNVQRKLEDERRRRSAGDVLRKESCKSTEKRKVEKGGMEKLARYGSTDDEKDAREDGVKEARTGGRRGKDPARGRRKRIRKRRGERKGAQKDVGREGRKRKPTLLRMLLEKEIAKEHSVLLQAFRYLIKQRREAELKEGKEQKVVR